MAAENVTIQHDVENLTINGRVTNLLINGEVVRMAFGPSPAAQMGTEAVDRVLRAPTRHKLPDAFFDGPGGINTVGDALK